MQSQRIQRVSWNFQVKLNLKKLELKHFEERKPPVALWLYHFIFLNPVFNSVYCILKAAGVTRLLITKSGMVCGRCSGCTRNLFDLNFIFNFQSSLNSAFSFLSFFFPPLNSRNKLCLCKNLPRKPGYKKATESTLVLQAIS